MYNPHPATQFLGVSNALGILYMHVNWTLAQNLASELTLSFNLIYICSVVILKCTSVFLGTASLRIAHLSIFV